MNPKFQKLYDASYLGIETRMMMLLEKWNANLQIQNRGYPSESGETVRDNAFGDTSIESGIDKPDAGNDGQNPVQ
jgi:hypothetical protein